MTLAEFFMILVRNGRAVYIHRYIPSKGLIQAIVFRCRGKVLVTTDYMGDLHQMVIDDIGKIVCRISIGLDQDHIIQLLIWR